MKYRKASRHLTLTKCINVHILSYQRIKQNKTLNNKLDHLYVTVIIALSLCSTHSPTSLAAITWYYFISGHRIIKKTNEPYPPVLSNLMHYLRKSK